MCKAPRLESHGSAKSAEVPPEELWQVHGAYYDLNAFAKVHPGGVEQIIAQRGQDCTDLFETVHLFEEQPKKLLAKYYVRDVPGYAPTLVWTGDGFYPTLKRRVKVRPTLGEARPPGSHPHAWRGRLTSAR